MIPIHSELKAYIEKETRLIIAGDDVKFFYTLFDKIYDAGVSASSPAPGEVEAVAEKARLAQLMKTRDKVAQVINGWSHLEDSVPTIGPMSTEAALRTMRQEL